MDGVVRIEYEYDTHLLLCIFPAWPDVGRQG